VTLQSNLRRDAATTRLPISAVVATRDRPEPLRRYLESLLLQEVTVSELIFVDASSDESSRLVVSAFTPAFARVGCQIYWERAIIAGAAAQRNQGVAAASQPIIGFFDDDILLEPCCLSLLWEALSTNPALGGVSAMITNQRYETPGLISRTMFRLMAGKPLPSYAGRVLGPAINLWPEDRADLPKLVPVEWLITGCTLYRREAIPSPPFSSHFVGYSLMEDVWLSVTVGRQWDLVNVRGARIFHDSQPGAHKADPVQNWRMTLVNRYYVMTSALGRTDATDYLKLALWQAFGCASSVRRGPTALMASLRGTFFGILDITKLRK
jgi:glycosyltransferase involved in cell wall biosynthesis